MTDLPFRTIVFDLDGTLADTLADLAAALNHALAALGRATVPIDAVRAMIGHGTPALLRHGLAATGGADQEAMARGYPLLIEHYAAHVADHSRLYPGVIAALDRLRAGGATLAICTNKPEALARRLLDALGCGDRFAAVIGGDTTGATKPDPAPLHHAIAAAGGPPAAYVGDSIVDVETARAAGVPCVVLSHGFADRPAAALGADAVIDRVAALPAALAGIADREAG